MNNDFITWMLKQKDRRRDYHFVMDAWCEAERVQKYRILRKINKIQCDFLQNNDKNGKIEVDHVFERLKEII